MAPPHNKVSLVKAAAAVSQNNRNKKVTRGSILARSIWDYLPEVSYPNLSGLDQWAGGVYNSLPEVSYPDYQHYFDYTIPHYQNTVLNSEAYKIASGLSQNFPYTEPLSRKKSISIQPQTKQKKQVQQKVQQQKKVQQKKQVQQQQVRQNSSSSHPLVTYSFSGADCKAWAYFTEDSANPELIESLGTISISVHESKSPVRRLGHMAPVGYTRAIRTIAGSMVLTIIGSVHPFKLLSNADPRSIVYYSQDGNNSGNIVTKMSPFNLILLYKSELPGAKGAKLKLKGVEFINEGLVTSVNDLVSEVVLQFVALDIESFDEEKDFF